MVYVKTIQATALKKNNKQINDLKSKMLAMENDNTQATVIVLPINPHNQCMLPTRDQHFM